jgi:rod shape-determining protein MreB
MERSMVCSAAVRLSAGNWASALAKCGVGAGFDALSQVEPGRSHDEGDGHDPDDHAGRRRLDRPVRVGPEFLETGQLARVDPLALAYWRWLGVRAPSTPPVRLSPALHPVKASNHGRCATVGLASLSMALDVALDIGTSNTRLATSQRGIVFNEPTMVAIDTNTGSVVEVGFGALDMVARTPRHVVVFRPLAQGATVDFDVTARLIHGLFDRAGVSKLSRARVVMSVPSLATSIERRALRQAAIQAGAREATLIEAPIAAAIGMGLPVQDPVGSAVTVLGAGASEAAVISLGGIVTGSARRQGGNDLDAPSRRPFESSSVWWWRRRSLRALKFSLASALGRTRGNSEVVLARTVDRGDLVEVDVDADLVNAAAHDVVTATVRMIQECLGDAPPDLSQDVSARGLTLTGAATHCCGLRRVDRDEHRRGSENRRTSRHRGDSGAGTLSRRDVEACTRSIATPIVSPRLARAG